MRYKIVLYNAGKRIKVFGSFDKYSEANEVYQLNLVDNVVYFPKINTWTGKQTDFELVLLGPPDAKHLSFVTDDLGRTVTIKPSTNHTVKKISPYFIEEMFLHKNTGNYYTFLEFARKFVAKSRGGKAFHCIKNKLVMENMEYEKVDLFILKNPSDCLRLLEAVQEYCMANKLLSHLFFTNPDYNATVRLYDLLEATLDLDRKYLHRDGTR